MRISHKHKLVFLANPRTGSTTIRDLLGPYSDVASVHVTEISKDFPFYHHITGRELKQIFDSRGWDWAAYRKFCVVRNPFDRVVSLYHHKLRSLSEKAHGKGPGYNLMRQVKYAVKPIRDFSDYVERIDPTRGLTVSLQAFICDAGGEPVVEDVIKFEQMSSELPKYLTDVGIPVSADDIRHLNASEQRRSYRDYYDDRTRQRVADLYGYEIARFGYGF